MLRSLFTLCLLLAGWSATTGRLVAQTTPDQIRITKTFGYQQTSPTDLIDYRPSADVVAAFRGAVSTTWTVEFGNGVNLFFPLVRDPRSSPFDTTFLASRSFDTNDTLNLNLPTGNFYNIYVTFGGSGAGSTIFPATFDTSLPTTVFSDFDALQSWNGEPRTISWQEIPGATNEETRVFTLERADGTVVFDTRVNGEPLYNGSTFVELPKIESKAGEVFYATLTYTRLRNSTVIRTGGVVSLYQACRVRVPIKRTPPPAPIITTPPLSLSAQVGTAVSFSVAATGETLSYLWKKDGTTVSGATSATLAFSSVQTAQAGTYTVTVTNPGGSITSEAATLTIAPTLVAPVVTSISASQTVNAGAAVTLRVTHTGTAPFTYQWLRNNTVIVGATALGFTVDPVTVADAGTYTVRITNAVGTVTSTGSTLTVQAQSPAIVTNPGSITVVAGAKVALGVTVSGTAPFSYQWLRNDVLIAGATNATFTLDPALIADSAAYRVSVANTAGTVISTAGTLTVTAVSRISNLSVLTSLSAAGDNFTLGYVVGGAGTSGAKPLVLRAAGPALGALGVGGTLEDPKLETFTGSAPTGENDNWGGSATLSAAFTSVGAFPFAAATSRDAALSTSLSTRDNSVKISAATAATGLVLAEIYDATSPVIFTTTTPRLLNVSVLKSLGTGLTLGFTIAGTSAKAVLLRAIGPTLGDFGVPGTVLDPLLTLYNASSAKVAENDNWGGSSALTAAFSSVGAFALPATSRDAALLATLPPGGYSVQVTGLNATTGVALVEVYEIP